MATGGFAVFQPWWKTTPYPHPWIFQRNKTQYLGAKWRMIGTPTKRLERTEVANFHEISERAGHALCGLLRSDEGNPQGARQVPCARSKKGVSGMKIIKRSGSEVTFDINKIVNAIKGANGDVVPEERLTEDQIALAAHSVEWLLQPLRAIPCPWKRSRTWSRTRSWRTGRYEVARKYIIYRYVQTLKRQSRTPPTTRSCRSSSATTRRSSRRTPTRTRRSTPCSATTWPARSPRTSPCRLLLPRGRGRGAQRGHHPLPRRRLLRPAHAQLRPREPRGHAAERHGHLRHADREARTASPPPATSPRRSSPRWPADQYGGQSISLTHLAPFVRGQPPEDPPRGACDEINELGVEASAEQLSRRSSRAACARRSARGVQTIQYQVVTLMTTNGQAPFVTVFMYLDEARNEQEKRDLAHDHRGDAAPALRGREERGGRVDHARRSPSSSTCSRRTTSTRTRPYFYLTQLAAKCTAKRMVPDYISEKKMRELKLSKGETRATATATPAWAAAASSRPTAPATATTTWPTPATTSRASRSTTAASTRASSPSTCVDVALSSQRRRGQVLADLRRAPRAVLQGAYVPPQPPEGHAVRRSAHPVAVRRARAPEEGRDHRQAALRRLLHHLAWATRACTSA